MTPPASAGAFGPSPGTRVDALCSAAMPSGCAARSLAPILVHFVHRVAERARDADVEAVWFLAREGFLLKAIYDRLAPHVGAPRSRYLCVSRTTTTPASMSGLGPRELFLAGWNGEDARVRTLLAPLGLGDWDLRQLAFAHGLDPEESVDPMRDARMLRLVARPEVQASAEARGGLARRALLSYLDACGFLTSSSAALVDVGWGLQIQENLEIALAGRGPTTHGLYMVLRRMAATRRVAGCSAEGLVHDPEGGSGWAEASALVAVDLFEDACRAPHPTVVGYEGGRPVLADEAGRSRRAEAADDRRIAALQRSVAAYADAYAGLLSGSPFPSEETRRISVSHMARLARFPSRREAEALGSFAHSLGCDGDGIVLREPRPSLLRPAAIRRHVGGARWREASAGACLGVPGQLLVARSWLRSAAEGPLPVRAVASAPKAGRLPRQSGWEPPCCLVEALARDRHERLIGDREPISGRSSPFGLWHAILLRAVAVMNSWQGTRHRMSSTQGVRETLLAWLRP